jgi:hypothetical protein
MLRGWDRSEQWDFRNRVPFRHSERRTKMPKGNSAVPYEERPFQKMLTYMRERAEIDSQDWSAEELEAQQVDTIMSATTEDELFAAMKTAGLTGLRDLESGQVIRIHGFRLLRGELGIGVYAVLDADDPDTGESFALDTGVTRILAFLRMCEVMEKFPVEVQIVKKSTQSGNELISLKKRPSARAVKSTAE